MPKTARDKNSFEMIEQVCDEVKGMLLQKHQAYGESALRPLRIMSHSDALEQIRVRIDDKLSRLAVLQSDETEDVVLDLIGYFILYRVALRLQGKSNE
jgi:hypothetical protein